MKSELNHIKGIHPGLVLNRELNKRNLRKGAFALSLQEYPQTITAITKGKRGMNTALSLKIEKALDIKPGSPKKYISADVVRRRSSELKSINTFKILERLNNNNNDDDDNVNV